jgi:hypothetical protein
MRKVIEVSVPAGSSIWQTLPSFGFSDAYQVQLRNAAQTPQEIYEAIFNYPPAWVPPLFVVRGWFAKLLGLKHLPLSFGPRATSTRPYQIGDRAGLFSVYSSNPGELILREDDSHLDFRLSIYKAKSEEGEVVIISTVVLMHNQVGRAYMKVVEPFHRALAKSMVQRAADNGRL